jgi:hypothetical protein
MRSFLRKNSTRLTADTILYNGKLWTVDFTHPSTLRAPAADRSVMRIHNRFGESPAPGHRFAQLRLAAAQPGKSA